MDEWKELFAAYGIEVRELKNNDYHWKLIADESKNVYDWYHTTGTLLFNTGLGFKKFGRIKDPEDVANIINRYEETL